MEYMRIWKEVDLQDVKEHIIMVDDQRGYCPNCKQLHIDIKTAKKCPGCSREFKYVTSAESSGGKSDIVVRLKKKLPDLIFVDFNDYERLLGKKKAENLFNV